MIIVAVLLMPMLGLLLYGMDRLEERLFDKPQDARPAHGRHRLRLIHGASEPSADQRTAGRHVDAA
ncbi:hypothetical protein OG885_01610 [Streptomyces sp. NBC_00028]|uniref:hypothetical protein n=1 Tax=Streptomyces sp. NBC_00028 TaxID=2975624 RepID=UPI00324F215A